MIDIGGSATEPTNGAASMFELNTPFTSIKRCSSSDRIELPKLTLIAVLRGVGQRIVQLSRIENDLYSLLAVRYAQQLFDLWKALDIQSTRTTSNIAVDNGRAFALKASLL